MHLRKGDRSFGLGGKVVRVYGMQVRVFDTIEQMQLETGAGMTPAFHTIPNGR